MSFISQPVTLQSLFGTKRQVGELTLQVVINESTNDTLTITKQPVQQGASITDHAYKEPTVLSMSALFQATPSIEGLASPINGNSNALAQLYQELLDLQQERIPFTVITPKRIYNNMLLAVLSLTTDKHTENILALNMSFQEVIIVSVVTTQVPRVRQKNPGATGATQNAGKKSALLSLKEGVGALFQ